MQLGNTGVEITILQLKVGDGQIRLDLKELVYFVKIM